jgi:lipoprotein-anchoring transpeptidase ErfK/SrfK
VTSSSHQPGSWHWYNDQEVHWRPATYWKPGTRVTATADLNSLPAGNGLYGQMSTSTSFTVGKSVITKVNLATDVAKVYINGKKVRTIYVSGGKPGWETRSGTSLITQKATNYRMTSQMIGLPKDGPQAYDLRVKYALRITNSGEFLHSAPWNSAYFGRQNASHGCVGMSNEDAGWLYENAPSGSPVTVSGTNRELDALNGLTDWNVDFETYRQGSAL